MLTKEQVEKINLALLEHFVDYTANFFQEGDVANITRISKTEMREYEEIFDAEVVAMFERIRQRVIN